MASLYKKPVIVRDPRTGRKTKTKSKKWWGRFTDEYGKEKRVPLAVDKMAAQAMLTELVRKAERRMAGLTDPFEKHTKKLLAAHLDDFADYLTNKGSTPDHVKTTKQRALAVIKGCKFERINDISPSRVQEYLAHLRAKGKSIASSNHYLRAVKMFTRWLVRGQRTFEDRLLHLSRMNADTDRKRVRRPLTIEEFVNLIKAVETGKPILHISGPDRAVLYILGAYTGFRRKEIASIRPHSFQFDTNPPTLTIEAAYSKRRRTDVIPLRKDFAERIQAWMDSRPGLMPDQSIFQIARKHTAEMIRRDLAKAGIPYKDARGYYADFHSLRKTFITNLSRAGVAPKTAQMLARHSDINLTMNVYTMLAVTDQAAAVETLPPVPLATANQGTMQIRLTGT